MADLPESAYVDTLADQLCTRHSALLASAEDDLAVLRGRIALVAALIHDPAYDLTTRTAVAQRLAVPEPADRQ